MNRPMIALTGRGGRMRASDPVETRCYALRRDGRRISWLRMSPARVRRASFASRAPGKTPATSGSSVTTRPPLALREAYLFARERLKSYSGRTSSIPTGPVRAFLVFAFLIFSLLTARCSPRTDQMKYLVAFSKHYHEQAAPIRLADEHETLLAL